MPTGDAMPMGDKVALRREAAARRRNMPARTREAADQAIARAAAELVAVALRTSANTRICAYLPMSREPGGSHLLPVLTATGAEVLLPVVLADRDLDWVRYGSDPHQAAHRLGPAAAGSAALLLVPALAVDRRGVRLGRGGGSYDRALARVPTGTPVVALLYDGEIVEKLPAEPHDQRVTAVLTTSGLITLP